MTIQEEFSNIIETENKDALIPFLKNLNKGDKKSLSPVLKKKHKYYYEYVNLDDGDSWGLRATQIQKEIISLAGYVCFDYKTYQSEFLFNAKQIESVIDFYQPSWLNEFINSHTSKEWFPGDLTYEWLMEKTKAGIISPSNELIVKTIGRSVYQRVTKKKQNSWKYVPKKLEVYEETLKEHIWLLFKYETNIYHETRWIKIQGDKDESIDWIHTISNLCTTNKVPRQRVLKEALVATTLDFNRNLINWYIDLFSTLKPNVKELLFIQPELFQTFNSAQSKPKNEVLKLCKKLVLESSFDNQAFLENTPILLASETKSVVNSTLIILEKMAKKEKELGAKIAQLSCNAFLQNDESVQMRAAKIIAKYGSSDNDELKEEIKMYQSDLVLSVKELLGDYLEKMEEAEAEEIISTEPKVIISDTNQVLLPETFDDFIFLASQVFEGNESWHIDIFPAALIKFHHEIDINKADQLAPAIQKMYKIIFDNRTSPNIGLAENLLAYFLFEYAIILLDKFPKAKNIKAIRQKNQAKELVKIKQWPNYKPPEVSLKNWKENLSNNILFPFKEIMQYVLNQVKMENKNPLPLLSTPTHQPYWIDPEIYIDRLSQYQLKDEIPNDADWQVAISRIAFENLEEAIQLAKEKLKGDWLEMTMFLFEKNFTTKKREIYSNEWIMTAYTKGSIYGIELFENNSYKDFAQREIDTKLNYTLSKKVSWHDSYDYSKNINERKKNIGKDFSVRYNKKNFYTDLLNSTEKRSGYRYSSMKTEDKFYLHEHLDCFQQFHAMGSDIPKLFSLSPNNLDPILVKLLGVFFGDSNKQNIVAANTLLQYGHNGSKVVHLFIACTMIGSDKTVRSLGAELWIQGVLEEKVDSLLMGELLGEMERIEFFPLKRLTDLILESMTKISSKHNQGLEMMIQELVKRIPDEAIKNTKKLLEIYRELLVLNKTELTNVEVKSKLEIWKDISSLKKIVTQLF